MISEFQGKRRIFTFPKAWANTVVRWIAGVHSPNGTMEISNTLNPGDDGSLGLDVNLDAVVDKVKVRLGFDKRSLIDRNDVRDIVFDLLDGASVINSGRRVAVNPDWLNANIGQGEGGGVVSSVNGQTGAVVLTYTNVGAASSGDLDTVSESLEELIDVVDGIVDDYLSSVDIGVSVAAFNHTHNDYASSNHTHSGYAASTHSHSLSDINGSVSGHSGNCLLTVNGSTIGHSGNDWYNALSALVSDYNGNSSAIPYIKQGYNSCAETIYIRISSPNKWIHIYNSAVNSNNYIGDGCLWLDGGERSIYFRNSSSDNSILGTISVNGSIMNVTHNETVQLTSTSGFSTLNKNPPNADYNKNTTYIATTGWAETYFAHFNHGIHTPVADQSFNVVTDVVWNGTSLVKKTVTLSTHKGIITTSSNMQPVETVIDTPTVVSWS